MVYEGYQFLLIFDKALLLVLAFSSCFTLRLANMLFFWDRKCCSITVRNFFLSYCFFLLPSLLESCLILNIDAFMWIRFTLQQAWLVLSYAFAEILETKEMHTSERKASAEKNQKRRLKTPDQVKALEKFYIGKCISFSKVFPFSHCLFHDWLWAFSLVYPPMDKPLICIQIISTHPKKRNQKLQSSWDWQKNKYLVGSATGD